MTTNNNSNYNNTRTTTSTTTNATHNLRYLNSDDDYKVHHNDPDIRGWDIHTVGGEEIGEVENLVFDPATKKVRYAVVELEDDLFQSNDRTFRERFTATVNDIFDNDDDQHILIPIGLIDVDRNSKRLTVRGSQPAVYYANAPRYTYSKNSGYIGSPDYEVAVARWYATHNEDDHVRNYYSTDRYTPETFKGHSRINDDTFYGSSLFDRDAFRSGQNDAATTRRGSSLDPAGPIGS